ncbi:hypothetical protein G5714_008654 [Onychostoma macrolepis]|uniref:Uncharacterized protein n=1 Tax=Onychostoma macrolepis TaxID=369639 RepID=A0A7J6CY82_9TELE|nr:hypothetical protein G5714_008654 [Onychostoma macrolepis]
MKVPIESKSWKHGKATTCTVCEENCHEFDCWWSSNPSKCEVMKDGYCTEIEDQKSILLSEAYQTINNLSQIALKPDSAFTLQHLDFFIPRVREAGKESWARELEEKR